MLQKVSIAIFQPTLSVWRETFSKAVLAFNNCISTHSLRVERDANRSSVRRNDDISTHSLRVERDSVEKMSVAALVGFQPTLSVWRETGHGVTSFLRGWHFNPLSPCGERHRLEVFRELSGEFQPTLSVWRETERIARRLHKLVISTHSLRVERDMVLPPCRYARRYFNPLSPCGERLTS